MQNLKDLGADIFTVALDAATPDLFDRTRGKGVQSPHKWAKYWEILLDARDIFGPEKFGVHIIAGMGETEHEMLSLVQKVVDLGGHNHMFCFFPEEGSLMDHLPATPRDQWRRVQLGRYLIDYCDARIDHMKFDDQGRLVILVCRRVSWMTSSTRVWRSGPRVARARCRKTFLPATGLMVTRPPVTLPASRSSRTRRTSRKSASNWTFPTALFETAKQADMKPFRVLDTGVMEGRLNIAIGQSIVEAHQQGKVPDTLRFLRFPPTALVGRHQALEQEINLDYCRENEIGIARRITGGGAIFMEPGLLGWELVFDRKTLGVNNLPDLTREICEAAADGISRLGVTARFRPRNDIEVDGRKISGTGGFFDGDTLFFQGTVLVDMDPRTMVPLYASPAPSWTSANSIPPSSAW